MVESRSEENSDTIFENAVDTATRALDIFSITDDYEGRCIDTDSERILWWKDDEESIVKFTGIAELSSSANASISVDGETPEPTIPEWHESFRYYRLSKTTDDLFDAYRNQLLALEHLLTDMFEDESGDTKWLTWVLTKAHQKYDLSNHAPDEDRPVNSIIEDQWDDVRCKVFHSKAWGGRLNPRDSEDTELVKSRLKDLTRIYFYLIKNEFGRSPGTGGLTNYGFEHFAKPVIENREVEITYSDQESEFYPMNFSENLSSERNLLATGRIDIANLQDKTVQQISLTDRNDDEAPSIDSKLENRIILEDFDTLVIHKGITHITESRKEIS